MVLKASVGEVVLALALLRSFIVNTTLAASLLKVLPAGSLAMTGRVIFK